MLESSASRFAVIVGVAVAAHVATVLIRGGSRRLLQSRMRSVAKAHTLTGFLTSLIVFAIYFGAFGFVLQELGVSLATYLASASVIGLAVSFGSQGVVQDVITGLTVVSSEVYVPNRSFGNVVGYPQGYVRAYADVRLHPDESTHADIERRLRELVRSAYEQSALHGRERVDSPHGNAPAEGEGR